MVYAICGWRPAEALADRAQGAVRTGLGRAGKAWVSAAPAVGPGPSRGTGLPGRRTAALGRSRARPRGSDAFRTAGGTGVVDLRIRGGVAALPDGPAEADVLIDGGRILALVAPGSGAEARETLDASGCVVLPGAIDPHVHFRTPGMTDKEDWPSGSAAAVAGGVTTVLDMPNVLPATSSAEALAAKAALVEGRSWCHYGFFGGLEAGNQDWLRGLAKAGAIGFKVFLGESTASLPPPDPAGLRCAFRVAADLGRRVAVHAEDAETLRAASAAVAAPGFDLRSHGRARPAEAESRAVALVCALCAETGAPVLIAHLSTGAGADEVRRARSRGADAGAEATPHHLLLTEEDAVRLGLGSLAKVNPPLRGEADREALWRAVADGTVTQFGSDHAPHTPEERRGDRPPSGFAGVQNTLPALLGHPRLPLRDFVRLTAEGPARNWGLWPRKGRLAPGADADLAVVRPAAPAQAVRQWSRNPDGPLLRGCPVRAEVVVTLVDGQVAYGAGQPSGRPRGRWLRP